MGLFLSSQNTMLSIAGNRGSFAYANDLTLPSPSPLIVNSKIITSLKKHAQISRPWQASLFYGLIALKTVIIFHKFVKSFACPMYISSSPAHPAKSWSSHVFIASLSLEFSSISGVKLSAQNIYHCEKAQFPVGQNTYVGWPSAPIDYKGAKMIRQMGLFFYVLI